ncbi:MAG: hypothetical protein GF365_04595 [Candidatus Buchananbacteria bacterium]|nr:hypothetical protein [Candidatus Buchananbacteria bacterium]
MKISQYVKQYTDGKRITILDIFSEIKEFVIELIKFNKKGIKEEFGDVLHFIQLWLYWNFDLDGKTWKISQYSVSKFMARKDVWNKIYNYVGLPKNISGYVGNYNKIEKVINHLQGFDIDNQKAKEAYEKIVREQKYQRPYNIKEIKKFYPDKAKQLLNDPVHFWRAKTGIELIHKEPTKDEQIRIWQNWNKMSDQMKKTSDSKSLEFFGKDNEHHNREIMRNWE